MGEKTDDIIASGQLELGGCLSLSRDVAGISTRLLYNREGQESRDINSPHGKILPILDPGDEISKRREVGSGGPRISCGWWEMNDRTKVRNRSTGSWQLRQRIKVGEP